MLEGPEHRISFANAAYMRLVGDRPVIGQTVAEALPEAAAQGYVDLLDSVFQSGTATTSFGAKFVVEDEPGGAIRERYVDFVYQPIEDEGGRVTGVFVDGRPRKRKQRSPCQTTPHFVSNLSRSWDMTYATHLPPSMAV